MGKSYIKPFLTGTATVLKTMASTSFKTGQPFLKPHNKTLNDISAEIEISGGTKGVVCISFSESCLLGIFNAMLGESYDVVDNEVVSLAGEIMNMVSGEARKHMAEDGFVFTGGIPKVTRGKGEAVTHNLKGAPIAIPLTTDKGGFSIEAIFESKDYFNQVEKTQKIAKVSATNKSLIPIELTSFIGTNNPPFKSYLLKLGSQITQPNFFLLPEYIGAAEGHEACNFTSLEVHICPKTFFASSTYNDFAHIQNKTNPLLTLPGIADKVLPKLAGMRDVMGQLPKSMFSVNRTVENAILAYNLAITTSETLYSIDPKVFNGQLRKIAEYSLKAALLSKYIKSTEREVEFIKIAHAIYKRLLPQSTGEQFLEGVLERLQ